MRNVDRRKFVSGIGAATLASIAGCSGGGPPTETPTPTPSRGDLVERYRSELGRRRGRQ